MVLEISRANAGYSIPAKQLRVASPVFNGNTKGKENIFSAVKEESDRLEKTIKDYSAIYQTGAYALSPIPTVRRLGSLPSSIEENNWPRAGLLVGLAAASLPRDWQEMKTAFKEINGNEKWYKIFNNFGSKFKRSLNHKRNPFQRQLNYFDDTFLSWLPKKFPRIRNIDKTLADTKFGEAITKLFKIKAPVSDVIKGMGPKGKDVFGYVYEGNRFQRLTGRALQRTPVIGIIVSGLLETPALIKSLKQGDTIAEKGKSFGKQLLKSAAYVGLMTLALGYGGALLATSGTLLSLVGTGVGSSLALIASNQINKFVDKVIS